MTGHSTRQPFVLPTGQQPLTVPQIAVLLGVSDDKARRWCREGKIEGAWNTGEDGKHEFWRATVAAVEAFREARKARINPPPPPGSRRRWQLRYARPERAGGAVA